MPKTTMSTMNEFLMEVYDPLIREQMNREFKFFNPGIYSFLPSKPRTRKQIRSDRWDRRKERFSIWILERLGQSDLLRGDDDGWW